MNNTNVVIKSKFETTLAGNFVRKDLDSVRTKISFGTFKSYKKRGLFLRIFFYIVLKNKSLYHFQNSLEV